jgi:hypothetical protein
VFIDGLHNFHQISHTADAEYAPEPFIVGEDFLDADNVDDMHQSIRKKRQRSK